MDASVLATLLAAFVAGIFSLITTILALKEVKLTRRKTIAVFSLVLVLILIFALFFIIPETPSLKITYPLPATFASTSVQVRGVSEKIPSGEQIWVVVYDGAQYDNRYYPNKAPATVQANGDWFDSVNLGGANDVNWTFLIFAALVNRAGHDAINNYWQNNSNPGWASLPDGIKTYDLTAVIRGP